MNERQVRTLFGQDNPRYLDGLRQSNHLMYGLYSVLPHVPLDEEGVLPSCSLEFVGTQERFATEISPADTQNSSMNLQGVTLTVPEQGQNLRITRYSPRTDLETSETQDRITAEALFNLETQDGGIHIGRTLFALGNVAVEGKPLRQKTDKDISMLESFTEEYKRAIANAQALGELTLPKQPERLSSFLSGPIIEAAGTAYAD